VRNWVSNEELQASAYRLAGAMAAMLRADGLDVDITGVPDQEDADVFAETFDLDAQTYMSMDPAKLEEEYEEIRLAASDTSIADSRGVLSGMRIDIESLWVGDAATAFSEQLNKIISCVAKQHEYSLNAAQAVGMMYAINVQFRASCLDLMDRTTETCESVTNELGNPGNTWAEAGLHLVSTLISAIGSPAQIGKLAIDEFLGLMGKATGSRPVEGAEAIPVVTGYRTARDRLFNAYEDNLGQIRTWLTGVRDEYAGIAGATIPEPLPACADVDSPDFRYELFKYHEHVAAEYAPEVERERRRYADEKAKPDGVIAQRLGGE
jgi:hypothetical protein